LPYLTLHQSLRYAFVSSDANFKEVNTMGDKDKGQGGGKSGGGGQGGGGGKSGGGNR
jgi:hypothetical protein